MCSLRLPGTLTALVATTAYHVPRAVGPAVCAANSLPGRNALPAGRLAAGCLQRLRAGHCSPYPDHLVRDRFEVLHATLVVAACKRRERLDQGRHDLAGRHLTLRQALPELGRQLGECLYITCRGIGQGTVDITKRYASPWEGTGCDMLPPPHVSPWGAAGHRGRAATAVRQHRRAQ